MNTSLKMSEEKEETKMTTVKIYNVQKHRMMDVEVTPQDMNYEIVQDVKGRNVLKAFFMHNGKEQFVCAATHLQGTYINALPQTYCEEHFETLFEGIKFTENTANEYEISLAVSEVELAVAI